MDGFEQLILAQRASIERYVRYRIQNQADAEDVLQCVYIRAYEKFGQLKSTDAFKTWMIAIARNMVNDFYHKKAVEMQIPVMLLNEKRLSAGRQGLAVVEEVRSAVELLGEKDKQILYLYYWKELPQAEIAKILNIPLGTVKSRLNAARQRFKEKYPVKTDRREIIMKKMPKTMPVYTIEKTDKPPFSVKWEELMGWFLVPKLGETLTWGMYDMPSGEISHIYEMKVTGKAKVHGIEGVELTARESEQSGKKEVIDRTFVAQLTDTHCRYLATMRNDGDVRNYITFLDEDEFFPNWGFGENNCGNEVNLSAKGDITRIGDVVTAKDKPFLLDIIGRYAVTINGKTYDTVCVMDVETYNGGVVSEQFLDENGKTILWRRFNRNDWAIDRYKKPWTELLPENDRITVNGTTYVQWYDCITDYIL